MLRLFVVSPFHCPSLEPVAMDSNPIDKVIAVPTFIGSLLSFLGSAAALIAQIARPPQRHFRHALIVNLLAAGNDTETYILSSEFH